MNGYFICHLIRVCMQLQGTCLTFQIFCAVSLRLVPLPLTEHVDQVIDDKQKQKAAEYAANYCPDVVVQAS